MRKINRKLKRWIYKWLINENLLRTYKHYRAPDSQKFWFGKPILPAPSLEGGYFKGAGLLSSVVRRLDDYRPAGTIVNRAVLPTGHCNEQSCVQFAVTPIGCWKPGQAVRIRLGNGVTEFHDLRMETWFDVRMELSNNTGNTGKLTVSTDAPIAITMPQGVSRGVVERGDSKIRHVLILVLDAWTTGVGNFVHPFRSSTSPIPNIEQFFAKGFRADQGISNGQWTLPAVASLFTGLHVGRHHMTHPTKWQEFDLSRRTLPEYFQHSGFHTLCGSVVSRVTPAFGHSRGFDRFLYHFVEPGYSYQKYDPAVWIQEIIGHLEAHHEDQTFSYFQFPDTHPSWDFVPDTRYFHLGRRGNTSADLRGMLKSVTGKDFDVPAQAVQIYLLRLLELDRMFGSVFDYIEKNFGDEALVVVTADHGLRMPYLSEAYRNDEPFLTDIRVNIPLFMKGANVPHGVYNKLCSPNIDIPKMLLNLCGIEHDSNDMDGLNILDPNVKRDTVISEYIYDGVYEIAVRGYENALFLKFNIDDVSHKLLSQEPFYVGLYPLGTETYLKEGNLSTEQDHVVRTLKKVALDHISKARLR